MKKYKKVYIDYFGYDVGDFIACESCQKTSVDLHHLKFRSQGGKDIIENLAAVCRDCHNKCHDSRKFNEEVKQKHLNNL